MSVDNTQPTDPLALARLLLDEDRLRIAGLLAVRPSSVGDLAAQLSLKEATVFLHLTKLVEAGLVSGPAEGEPALFRLDLKALQALKRQLFAGQPRAAAEEATTPAGKVLRNFLDGERLKEIPASHAKRQVILAWLVAKFEPGVRYPERQVNAIIARHHPDYASLRRYLVDAGLMQRADGMYWRVV